MKASKLVHMSKVNVGIRQRGHLAMSEIAALKNPDLDDIWAFAVRFAQSEVDRVLEGGGRDPSSDGR
jgi:hypothetical protein